MTIETKYLKHDLDEVVSLAYTDLKTLEGSRLLITGGTGFVGKWLLYSLLNFHLQTQIKFEVIVGADRLQFSGNVEGEKISGELLRGNLVLPWFAQRQ